MKKVHNIGKQPQRIHSALGRQDAAPIFCTKCGLQEAGSPTCPSCTKPRVEWNALQQPWAQNLLLCPRLRSQMFHVQVGKCWQVLASVGKCWQVLASMGHVSKGSFHRLARFLLSEQRRENVPISINRKLRLSTTAQPAKHHPHQGRGAMRWYCSRRCFSMSTALRISCSFAWRGSKLLGLGKSLQRSESGLPVRWYS